MRKNGILLICDRCGTSKFLKKLKDGKFEEAPGDWGHYNGKDLCPDCSKKYEELLGEFFKNA